MNLSRRTLLTAASLAATPFPAWARDLARGVFSHGVASGDPLADRVVLWTRFVGAGDGRIGWEVAEDETFARVVSRGEGQARFTNDFCVKVDAGGLQPGRPYFYRFLSASGPSVTGMTRTAPSGRGTQNLKFALFSCANYAFGYFHAYAHAAAREDIDLVIHAGDYIYEVPRGAYPSNADTVPGRANEPLLETVSLGDYYERYALYHADPDLVELRRLKPFCAVWDDHELVNDTWRAGAGNHEPEEGDFATRMVAASKAYFDWMPIRRPQPNTLRLYRAFDWGDLARIVMLDTRLIGRDEQLSYRDAYEARFMAADANIPALAAEFRPFLDDPRRSMLGREQEAWLNDTLAQSKRNGQTWQVLAQQVQIGTQIAPAGLGRQIGANISAGGRAWFDMAEKITPHGLPWNLDSWNGYPAARARFLESCAANASNALVLGGDSHNCWVNNVDAASGGRRAAIEFAGGAVSSPGFERTLNAATPEQRAELFRSGNPNLAFCDIARRGYGAFTLTREGCAAEWVAVTSVREPVAGAPSVSRLEAAAGASAGPGPWTVLG